MTDNEHNHLTFAQQLREFRRHNSLNREQLSEMVGVSVKTVERWEREESQPRGYTIRKLSKLLGRSPQELGLGPTENRTHVAPAQPSVTPEPSTLPHTGSSADTPDSGGQPSVTPEASTLPQPRRRSRRRLWIAALLLAVIIVVLGIIIRGGLSQKATPPGPGIVKVPVSPCTWPIVNAKKDQSPLVRVIQWMLISPHQSGISPSYNLGPTGVDGQGGHFTQQAVKDFQRDEHLMPTGLVDTRTWEKLIVPSHINDSGSYVQALQEQLQARLALSTLSYSKGVYDQATEDAVKTFQHEVMGDQFVTGRADIATWCRLVGGQPVPFTPLVPDYHAPNVLGPAQTLGPEDQLVSPDHRFILFVQNTGQLLEEDSTNGQILFESPTGNDPKDAGAILMNQPADGNVVLRAPKNRPIWATATDGHVGATLFIQNDGKVVVYDANHRVLWNSFNAL